MEETNTTKDTTKTVEQFLEKCGSAEDTLKSLYKLNDDFNTEVSAHVKAIQHIFEDERYAPLISLADVGFTVCCASGAKGVDILGAFGTRKGVFVTMDNLLKEYRDAKEEND